MKTKLFILTILVILFTACETSNKSNTNPGDEVELIGTDTNGDALIGVWEINAYVNYSADREVEQVQSIPSSNNGKQLSFQRKEDSNDFILTLEYANILRTCCKFDKEKTIKIQNEWGGSELYDATDEENKLITFLNSVNHWMITDDMLYLIDYNSSINYNALWLKKK